MLDFPFCPVNIDGEYWIIFKNGYREGNPNQWIRDINAPVYRYKGSNMEDAVRQPDGKMVASTFPSDTGRSAYYILGGMWYDSTERKLYAPSHVEANRYETGVERQIHLVSSTDKGLTWKYEGLLISRDNPANPNYPTEFSGLFWNGGDGDHHLYVDSRGGYIYLYSMHWITNKSGFKDTQFFIRFRVARCAIADKMAPGKWWRFYNGKWNEPGVGGKASYVNAYRLSYNSYLQKYISINYSSGISICDDLSRQEWSPTFHLGNFWNMGVTANAIASWVTDNNKTDIYTSGQSFFVYNFWLKQPAYLYGVTLDKGITKSDSGFVSPSTRFSPKKWGFEHKISMNPGHQYPFEPLFESEDPVNSR
jgi:hypothetical protein